MLGTAMRLIQRLVLLYALLFGLTFARSRWGDVAEAYGAGGLAIFGVVAWGLHKRKERRLRRAVAALPLDEQIAAINSDPDIRDAAAGDVFGNERHDRRWQLTRVVGPLLGVFYLPLLYVLASGTDVNGLVCMALAFAGLAGWYLYARRYVGRYRCPTCRGRIPAVSLRPARFVCVPCATTWRL